MLAGANKKQTATAFQSDSEVAQKDGGEGESSSGQNLGSPSGPRENWKPGAAPEHRQLLIIWLGGEVLRTDPGGE